MSQQALSAAVGSARGLKTHRTFPSSRLSAYSRFGNGVNHVHEAVDDQWLSFVARLDVGAEAKVFPEPGERWCC